MTRLAVFDCDGTLVDGQADVCAAMVDAFVLAGEQAPDMNEVRRMVGLSLPVAMRRLVPDLPENRQAELVQNYKDAFYARRQSGRLHEPLYDGMRELLTGLHAAGWQLAVATGKSDRGLTACLETHGIIDLFVSLQTADRHPSKPHPAMLEAALFEAGVTPADAVMIGDTTFDVVMACDANVRAIGVAWGYHAPDELLQAGATAVASDIEALEKLL
ncbi:HAD-IA family hydrolase [Altererythrobacter arenosus]|uniref:HAD-IA family hydrolase n=1 Tax=Altererythrobacter arenosus TaxID=3032592 RepID=A0ABY8FUZ5_9SPHN|nr:HAD-IA family hydrolase [Altererythrobacter sp. CAU 1644]WFL78085.1 HAD-IA family hydrolase [Altererythrobacter sp. CAU 1644]